MRAGGVERAGVPGFWIAVSRDVNEALGYEGDGRSRAQCRNRYTRSNKKGLRRGP
jgi:hypothetical protein